MREKWPAEQGTAGDETREGDERRGAPNRKKEINEYEGAEKGQNVPRVTTKILEV